MTIFAFIAVATSALALVTVTTGILVLSIGHALKSFADKGVGTLASIPRKIHDSNRQGNPSEAKMPSLATLYLV